MIITIINTYVYDVQRLKALTLKVTLLLSLQSNSNGMYHVWRCPSLIVPIDQNHLPKQQKRLANNSSIFCSQTHICNQP